MFGKVTRENIESFLICQYKSQLELMEERGIASDYELMQKEARIRVRKDATGKLVHDKGKDFLQGVVGTFELLARGTSLLLNVTYEDNQLKIFFDGLQKADGPSQLGDFHYIPILIHEAERPGKQQKALLELLAVILASVQGKEPRWGIIIHGRDCQIHKVKLGRGASHAKRTLQQITELRDHGKQVKLRLNSHCQVCEFRERCYSQAAATDDLSLLKCLGEKEVKKYNRRGIFTVTQLSCTFRPKKRQHKSRQQAHLHQPALQALAIRDKKIYVLGSPKLPSSGVKIFFDVEGDPERGFDYLLGMIVEVEGVDKHYSFWADSRSDEPKIFQHFLDVISTYQDFCLYSYGSYEAAFLRRLMKLSGQEELAKSVLERLVNVLAIIHNHIYFPTYSNGLKEVGRYLSFNWTELDASGIQSIVWRRRWEETQAAELKDKLVRYNIEDCVALKTVTHLLYNICSSHGQTKCGESESSFGGHQVASVERIRPVFNRHDWCKSTFATENFEFINERAYFDYQRDKVFIRANTANKRKIASQNSRKKGKNRLQVNQHVEIGCRECPSCGQTTLTMKPDGRLARLAYDLSFTLSGVRRRVTRYTTSWYQCPVCKNNFLPHKYLVLEEHCHSLKSWAMYMHVAHRMSFNGIAKVLFDCYGLPLYSPDIWSWKAAIARYYQPTYDQLLKKIVTGPVIHADETNVHVARVGKGYVWVFASLEEVVFMYRPSREGAFLPELLKAFQGVLISDFYAAYDSIECEQQKCLIHLMRDFNNDLLSNPWDEEFKEIASQFGQLLRTIVATIDIYGLRRRHLHKHQSDVHKFYDVIIAQQTSSSELAEDYRKRLIKYRSKLFTFLDHDNVPWNNNSAEHAVKRFAKYRALVDGTYREDGLNQYLLLLSIYVTCEFKQVDFLKFLLSRETDIDIYALNGNKGNAKKRGLIPTTEFYPDGSKFAHPSRKQTWDRQLLKNPDSIS
jgi:predicted RecB family nuclease